MDNVKKYVGSHLILCIDLEATCSNDDSIARSDMEIIEFGCTILDENLNIMEEFNYFVRPSINPQLTDFCKELTTIEQNQVDNAADWNFVLHRIMVKLDKIQQIKGLPLIWASWGMYDKSQIKKDCDRYGVMNMFNIIPHINAKTVDQTNMKMTRGRSLKKAVNGYGIKFEGTLHRAIDDSRAVAKVLQRILKD